MRVRNQRDQGRLTSKRVGALESNLDRKIPNHYIIIFARELRRPFFQTLTMGNVRALKMSIEDTAVTVQSAPYTSEYLQYKLLYSGNCGLELDNQTIAKIK